MLHTMNVFTTSQTLTNDNKSNVIVLYESNNKIITYSTKAVQLGNANDNRQLVATVVLYFTSKIRKI